VVTVLEGGYDLAALRRSVKSVLQTMRTGHMEDNQRWIEREDAAYSHMQELIDMIKEIQKPYWNCF
jgi:acetoin utilization deacetylase AcuC-like enzyme